MPGYGGEQSKVRKILWMIWAYAVFPTSQDCGTLHALRGSLEQGYAGDNACFSSGANMG